MPLPPLIEIVPPDQPPAARITVPGSKSITNRALVLAALGHGVTELTGALWSEDTWVMVDCLRALGFGIEVNSDPAEADNRTITVEGQGGRIPPGGTAAQPLDLFVGNAGTAARFLAALVCLGQGAYRLQGVPRMHERPQAALFDALLTLGYTVDSPNGRLPAVVHGGGPHPARCSVEVAESSQFASALLLVAPTGGCTIDELGDHPDELPYVEMTRQLVRTFPATGGRYTIEPDASSASYIWAADWLLGGGGRIQVEHKPASGWQIDERFPGLLPLPPVVSRARDLGDSIMTAVVLAPFADHPVRFTDLGRLRVQECERVAALRTELTRCGADVIEEGDSLTVLPADGRLRGTVVETYDDHRMAMCFAILGLKVPGVRIQNPACVRKTFPDFFRKLAGPPPFGLGCEIRDGTNGTQLSNEALRAD